MESQPMSANQSSRAAEEAAIRSVLSYTEAVMPLYTEDGVFMPPNNPSAVGKAAVRQAYDGVFKAITLKVKFIVAELVMVSPEWAFVRTSSAGTNKINATGAVAAEGNQELFIFKKGADGQWRIARYSFSTTNPLAAA
jgi:ketosteroid isomerase-like protein